MNDLSQKLSAAVASGKLLECARENILSLLNGAASDLPSRVVEELLAAGNFDELNDRFFKTLAFGTGGLRGRTIGRTVTVAEQGSGGPNGRPEFPCIGTAAMNYYNVSRAVRGMIAYVHAFVADGDKPTFVFAH
ncbi:MAG: phospho-sugar mutase, partial [Armatimonadetes bacterium]|nr:phospho-sugar mutase [Akkermansiaceae bacterium]